MGTLNKIFYQQRHKKINQNMPSLFNEIYTPIKPRYSRRPESIALDIIEMPTIKRRHPIDESFDWLDMPMICMKPKRQCCRKKNERQEISKPKQLNTQNTWKDGVMNIEIRDSVKPGEIKVTVNKDNLVV